MLTKEEMPACPVAVTVQIIGSKWRLAYPQIPPRVEFALSELGKSMRPIIYSMEQWGTEYKKNWKP